MWLAVKTHLPTATLSTDQSYRPPGFLNFQLRLPVDSEDGFSWPFSIRISIHSYTQPYTGLHKPKQPYTTLNRTTRHCIAIHNSIQLYTSLHSHAQSCTILHRHTYYILCVFCATCKKIRAISLLQLDCVITTPSPRISNLVVNNFSVPFPEIMGTLK